MKARDAFAMTFLLLPAAAGFAQNESIPIAATTKHTASPRADAPVVGLWQAEKDGLPWVTLTLTDEGGILSGAVLFYLHRGQPGGPVTSSVGVPEPLLHPRFDGKSLTFSVSHRHAHMPEFLSSAPIEFRLDLSGNGRAMLMNVSEDGPSAMLVRSDH